MNMYQYSIIQRKLIFDKTERLPNAQRKPKHHHHHRGSKIHPKKRFSELRVPQALRAPHDHVPHDYVHHMITCTA